MSEERRSLTGATAANDHPANLRGVKYRDPGTQDVYECLTNNMDLSATVIAQLYKQRWQVELFFKWIKQHLRIKVFYGTSENAVRVHIWTAITTYCLLARMFSMEWRRCNRYGGAEVVE